MLLYGETLKSSQKQLLTLKIEPIDQSQRNFGFSEQKKKFLVGGKKDNTIEKYLG